MQKFVSQYHTQKQIDEFNQEIKPFGFAYDATHNRFYTIRSDWQIPYEYHKIFDDVAPGLGILVDYEPIKFQYDHRDWMIGFWKGQYGILTGGEVGIFVKNPTELYYESVEEKDELYVEFLIRDRKQEFVKYEGKYWLHAAFVLGKYRKPSNLEMDIKIKFINEAMANAFYNQLMLIGYNGEQALINQETVSVYYKTPYAIQAKARTNLIGKMAMLLNKCSILIFQQWTKKEPYMLDKIAYIRLRIPKIYESFLRIITLWKKRNE